MLKYCIRRKQFVAEKNYKTTNSTENEKNKDNYWKKKTESIAQKPTTILSWYVKLLLNVNKILSSN